MHGDCQLRWGSVVRYPCSLSDRLILEGAFLSPLGGTISRSKVRPVSTSVECHGCQDLRACIGGLSLCCNVKLAW
jgi:hypothetical protein